MSKPGLRGLRSRARKRLAEGNWGLQTAVFFGPSLARLGIHVRLPVADRKLLENAILPFLAKSREYSRVMFVGTDWYTGSYPRLLAGTEVWTMDIDPAKARYGVRQKHFVAGMERLGELFEPDSLDAVICNGVFGWGLDERSACNEAFSGAFEVLRPGGLLVVGWNDTPRRRPFPLSSVEALQEFAPFVYPPLGAAEIGPNEAHRHVFTFYQRPEAVRETVH